MLDFVHVAWELLVVLTKHSFHGFSIVLIEKPNVFFQHVLIARVVSMSLSSSNLLLQQNIAQVDLVVDTLD